MVAFRDEVTRTAGPNADLVRSIRGRCGAGREKPFRAARPLLSTGRSGSRPTRSPPSSRLRERLGSMSRHLVLDDLPPAMAAADLSLLTTHHNVAQRYFSTLEATSAAAALAARMSAQVWGAYGFISNGAAASGRLSAAGHCSRERSRFPSQETAVRVAGTARVPAVQTAAPLGTQTGRGADGRPGLQRL